MAAGWGGMLNFGLSGRATVPGAVPSGDTILSDRWGDIGSLMNALQADWFFGISARLPAATDLGATVPDFQYLVQGPRVVEYGA
eukprot:3962971-Pyramimonas_sp.AAC.1